MAAAKDTGMDVALAAVLLDLYGIFMNMKEDWRLFLVNNIVWLYSGLALARA